MAWFPFCCTPASYLGDFSAKPATIDEIAGTWTYGDASPYGMFITSSDTAILAYQCEVMASPLVKLKLGSTITSGIRVYLRAKSDFTEYFCIEVIPMNEPDDEDRQCANLRLYTHDGLFHTTTIRSNTLTPDTYISLGLDLSHDGDPRAVCNSTTISLADYFPDGFDAFGRFVGFGTIPGNTEEVKFYDVEIKSYSGDCCGDIMPNPTTCDENSPCGGDAIGGTTSLYSTSFSGPVIHKPAGDFYPLFNDFYCPYPTELDWWSLTFVDSEFRAFYQIPSDRCEVAESPSKCASVEGLLRVTLPDGVTNCAAGGSWNLSLALLDVQDVHGAISRISVSLISDSCKATGTVSHSSSLGHTGAGTIISRDINGVCNQSSSDMCNQLASESLSVSLPSFPLGFIHFQINIQFDNGFPCKQEIGGPAYLYQAPGTFYMAITPSGTTALKSIESC